MDYYQCVFYFEDGVFFKNLEKDNVRDYLQAFYKENVCVNFYVEIYGSSVSFEHESDYYCAGYGDMFGYWWF